MSIPPSDSSNSAGRAARLRIVGSPNDIATSSVGATPAPASPASEFVRGDLPISLNVMGATQFSAANRVHLRALVIGAFRSQQSPFADNPAVVDAIVSQLTPQDGDSTQVSHWKLAQLNQLKKYDPIA